MTLGIVLIGWESLEVCGYETTWRKRLSFVVVAVMESWGGDLSRRINLRSNCGASHLEVHIVHG